MSKSEISTGQEISEWDKIKNCELLFPQIQRAFADAIDAQSAMKQRTQSVLIASTVVFCLISLNIESVTLTVSWLVALSLIFMILQFGIAVLIWLPVTTIYPGTMDNDILWNKYVDQKRTFALMGHIQNWTECIEFERKLLRSTAWLFTGFLAVSMFQVAMMVFAFIFSKS